MKILGVAQNIPTDIQYGRYFQEAPAHLLGLNRFLGGASALMGNSWRLLHVPPPLRLAPGSSPEQWCRGQIQKYPSVLLVHFNSFSKN